MLMLKTAEKTETKLCFQIVVLAEIIKYRRTLICCNLFGTFTRIPRSQLKLDSLPEIKNAEIFFHFRPRGIHLFYKSKREKDTKVRKMTMPFISNEIWYQVHFVVLQKCLEVENYSVLKCFKIKNFYAPIHTICDAFQPIMA